MKIEFAGWIEAKMECKHVNILSGFKMDSIVGSQLVAMVSPCLIPFNFKVQL